MDKITYSDIMYDITKDEILEGLLGYGMFAEKIPPIFTSKPLYDYCIDNGYNWLDTKAHSAVPYESMRNISVPRIFSIPYPTSYVNQCKFISDNWDDLQFYFHEKTERDTFTKSQIHIRKMQDKKELFEMNYKDFDSKYGLLETEISIGAKYVVRADISNCFPSVYTHAIPWALVGIEEAKRNQRDSSKWYNQLDFYTRALKDNETHGILIGPHSSNLISEIILVAVDDELQQYNYTRCIDDYTCFVSSQQEADNFVIDLANALKKYDLLLNHKKTEIIKLPLSSVDSWVTSLKSFEIPDEIGVAFLRKYLDTAIELANETGNIAVINFVIKTLSTKSFKPLALEYYINTIHNLLLLFPYLLPIIEDNVFMPLKIDAERIEKIANDIYEEGNKYNRFEAMSYAMYFAIKYDFKLRDDLLDKVSLKEDCVFMILSYIHDVKYLKGVKAQYKDIAIDSQNDFLAKDKYWLFIYEVLPKDELKDTCLKALKGKGGKYGYKKVSFIKQF
jgi:hypothetical protein